MSVLALAAVAACDLPTAAPKLEQQWAVPVASNRIAIAELLPASVEVTPDAFRVPLEAASATLRLQDFCGAICAVPGVRAPKPAFTATIPLSVTRPTDFASATLAGGDTVRLSVVHNFGFPLLLPEGAASAGSLAVELVIGRDTLRAVRTGTTTPWPSGSTLDIDLVLPAGATLSSDVKLLLAIDSPAGDSVTINGSTRLTASAAVGAVGVTSVSAAVPDVELTSRAVELDLSQFDADIASKARSAELTLSIENSLDVQGTFTLAFTGSHGHLIAPRSIAVRAGSSTATIALSRSDLDHILGQRITLTLTGGVTATGPGGLLTIRPTDAIAVDARLALAVVLP
jgi:hypothetical protein